MPKTCRWRNEIEYWQTACGQAHYLECDGPTENHYRYCPYCGKEITVSKRRPTLTEKLQALADELRTEDQYEFVIEYRRGDGWYGVADDHRWSDKGEYLGPDYKAAESTLRMLLG
jgi:hypothetical protein